MDYSEVINLILQYKYFIIFPLSFVEGPTTTITAGFLASLHYLNPIYVFLVVLAADLAGDLVSYSIGRKGESFIDQKGKYFGVTKAKIQRVKKFMKKNDIQTIFFGKFVPGFSIPTLVSMGLSKVKLERYLIIVTSAGVIKAFLLIMVGFLFGNAFNVLKIYLDIATAIGVLAAVLIVSYFILEKRVTRIFGKLGNGH